MLPQRRRYLSLELTWLTYGGYPSPVHPILCNIVKNLTYPNFLFILCVVFIIFEHRGFREQTKNKFGNLDYYAYLCGNK